MGPSAELRQGDQLPPSAELQPVPLLFCAHPHAVKGWDKEGAGCSCGAWGARGVMGPGWVEVMGWAPAWCSPRGTSPPSTELFLGIMRWDPAPSSTRGTSCLPSAELCQGTGAPALLCPPSPYGVEGWGKEGLGIVVGQGGLGVSWGQGGWGLWGGPQRRALPGDDGVGPSVELCHGDQHPCSSLPPLCCRGVEDSDKIREAGCSCGAEGLGSVVEPRHALSMLPGGGSSGIKWGRGDVWGLGWG